MTAQTHQAGDVAPFGRLLTNKLAIFAFFGIICASWAYIMANKSDSASEDVPNVQTVSATNLVPDISVTNVVEGSRLKQISTATDVGEVELEDAIRLAGRYLVQHGRQPRTMGIAKQASSNKCSRHFHQSIPLCCARTLYSRQYRC